MARTAGPWFVSLASAPGTPARSPPQGRPCPYPRNEGLRTSWRKHNEGFSRFKLARLTIWALVLIRLVSSTRRFSGSQVTDLTSELLDEIFRLVHPDCHQAERHDLAKRVTQSLLALKPFVFPAPQPKAKPSPYSNGSFELPDDDCKKPYVGGLLLLCSGSPYGKSDQGPSMCLRCQAMWLCRRSRAVAVLEIRFQTDRNASNSKSILRLGFIRRVGPLGAVVRRREFICLVDVSGRFLQA
jgi:hypothetical protein